MTTGRSRLRRAAEFFDPAQPGFLRRLRRVAVLAIAGLALAGCALVAAALGTPTGRYWAAVVLVEVHAYGPAESIARDLVAEYPHESLGYYRVLAAALRRSGRSAEQLEVMDAAVEALPDDWTAHSQRCWYGALFGDPAEVMDSCDRAVALAPERFGDPPARRGFARMRLGDREGAISDLEEGLARWERHGRVSEEMRRVRRGWIEALRAGREPLDEAGLEVERGRF